MKKKRKLKKRIGINLLRAAFILALAALLPLGAAPKKKPALDTYATLSGSVFDARGYALPEANVMVAAAESDSASASKTKGKVKPMEAVSDARGEFVLRVPPGPAHYNVSVEAKGYQAQRKTVSVQDQERVEVTFQLEHESK
jgi:hypothetical protein